MKPRTQRVGVSNRRGSAGTRGVTFLEVVFSVVLLGMVVSVYQSGMSFVARAQNREAQRLGAAEIANRLMLQYLDDSGSMPSANVPVDYQRWRYRWTLRQSQVGVEINEAGLEAAQNAPSGFGIERLQLVEIRVWLSEESGGAYREQHDTPSVTISRLRDPLGFEFQNPDSTENRLGTEEGLREMLNNVMELGEGGTVTETLGEGEE